MNFTDLHLNQAQSLVENSVFSPQTWPFSLTWLPPETYLVGGNVRDALLGRHAEYLDLDFVMADGAIDTAKAIANHHKAGFVLLDKERQIARVVFEQATADFAQQVGPSLISDLQRRDFTVNAIAYNPLTAQLIDPLRGYHDLQVRLIRMIAVENLKEDPLRLLRAYRQAAQLGFTLEPDTRTAIQQLTGLLKTIAAERIQAELNYLLSTSRGTRFLTLAWEDGLLQDWLPHATRYRLERVAQIDQAVATLTEHWTTLGSELSGWVRDQQKVSGAVRSWLKVAKLACLIAPDLELAEQELWKLKYSRLEIQSVLTILRFLPHLQTIEVLTQSRREQYVFFQGVGAVFPALAVLAVAQGVPVEAIAPLIDRFLDPHDPVAHPVPLLTGRDLMQGLKLPPGPQIGHLLEAIQLAQAEGHVHTVEAALEYAASLLPQK